MDGSFVGRLRYVIDVAWRRRTFLLTPLLVSIPLSVIGSAFLPERYEVRTLLLLQENSSDPLQLERERSYGSNARMAARALIARTAGLEALLKSERVLDSALKNIMGEKYPETIIGQEYARNKFARSISINSVGGEFLELRLKGSDPHALRKKLEVTTSRFLESLLMADQGQAAAGQIVLERRKSDLQKAKNAVKEFERKIAGEQAARNVPTNAHRLEAKKQELTTVELAIGNALGKKAGGLSDPKALVREIAAEPIKGSTPMHYMEKIIKGLRVVLSAARLTEFPNVATVNKPLAEPPEIAVLEARRDRLIADIQSIEATNPEMERTIELGKRLKRQLEEATANYQRFTSHYIRLGVLVERPPELVRSPENIRVIDPPKDPGSPVVARWMYVIAGIVAAFALGSSAAIGAEILDQRLRGPEEFVAVLGAPMICRLPNSNHIDDSPTQEIEPTQSVDNITLLREVAHRSEK